MEDTPWGNSGSLRRLRLPPGPGTPRSTVVENQRQRLYAAMVATVGEKGYEATTVGDLVALSGVSRKTFYQHFDDKQGCFLAVLQSLIASGVDLVRMSYASSDEWEGGVHAGLASFMRLLSAQPAAARLCFVDAYSAGPPALALVERAFDEFTVVVRAGLDRIPKRSGMPPEIVRAIVGGLRKVIHTRLHGGEEETLGDLVDPLWDWGLSYFPPPTPLRAPARRRSSAGEVADPPGQDDGPAERILHALAAAAAERGYPNLTVGQIAAGARVSLSTFYSYFEGKDEAVLAALDYGSAQMMAATLPAYRRAHDWPHAVRAAIVATFAFAERQPDYAYLGAIEVYAAGRRALELRDQTMDGLAELIRPGYEHAPGASPIAAEAIAGAVYALIYDQVRAKGPQSLPEIAPLATYVALCPFIGAERACEVANGDGRRR